MVTVFFRIFLPAYFSCGGIDDQKPVLMHRTAIFSPCRTYRYLLQRRWAETGEWVAFIGLNPSVGGGWENDATILRCIGFAQNWGFAGCFLVNLFAYRTPSPRVLKSARHPIGPENDAFVQWAIQCASLVIVAWGNDGRWLDRDQYWLEHIPAPYCIRQNRNGMPAHPLYLPGDLRPVPFIR